MLSPRAARIGMAIASLVGLFTSAYLLYTYVTGAEIACAIVSGCDIVRSSAWATSLGLPRPFWGVLFYTGFFGLLVLRSATNWKPKFLRQLTLAGVVIGFIESFVLFLVQWIDLRAFCFWCLLSGVSALLLAIFSFFDRPKDTTAEADGSELRLYFYLLLGFLPLAALGFLFLLDRV
jgi:uncharacterized membrane protein